MLVDPRSDRPVYHQIADELRRRIVEGVYVSGAQLPSETDLLGEFDFSRLTVRRALAVLQQEGLTEARRGRGVFVRNAPPVVRLGNSRFSRAARAAGKGALAAEAERLGLTWSQQDLGLEAVPSPPAVALALGQAEAAVKRRLMLIDGEPTQLADSYVPLDVAEDIGFLRGDTAPGGLYGLLDQHGHTVTRFREELAVRSATPEEAVALHLPLAAPVVLLVRLAFNQEDRVVEYFDSVAAGDRHRYVYEFDAPRE
ncbi:GntR family transcriptional regulator [Actinokineospora sp.]|uniref:GntR family transcriptional regulator n=1 Tax=Actinokineospora sp. TaxID=1872133 RepID=UPI004037A7E5